MKIRSYRCYKNVKKNIIPQEIVDGGQKTLEAKHLLHHPFHSHHFTSTVHTASYAEISLSHAAMPNK